MASGRRAAGVVIGRMLTFRGHGDFREMNKAFVKESEDAEDDEAPEAKLPAGTRNYMTVRGHAALRAEFEHLVKVERPAIVQVVSWAAGNGDRSENGDYIYGKKRLREIDRRIRFLTKRLESAVIVDPAEQQNRDQVFFAATVTVCDAAGDEVTYQIVGIDEANARKAASAGSRRWRGPCSRRAKATRCASTAPAACASWISSRCATSESGPPMGVHCPQQQPEQHHRTGLVGGAEGHGYLQQQRGDAQRHLHRQPQHQ
jgi:transcription elongation factor GreB